MVIKRSTSKKKHVSGAEQGRHGTSACVCKRIHYSNDEEISASFLLFPVFLFYYWLYLFTEVFPRLRQCCSFITQSTASSFSQRVPEIRRTRISIRCFTEVIRDAVTHLCISPVKNRGCIEMLLNMCVCVCVCVCVSQISYKYTVYFIISEKNTLKRLFLCSK